MLTTGNDDDTGNSSNGDTTTSSSTNTSVSASGSATNPDPSTSDTGPSDTTSTADSTGSDTTQSGTDGTCPPGQEGCPCDGEGNCPGELQCDDGVCVPFQACLPDDNEPNGNESEATFLGDINDSDASGSMISGVIDHADDVDWYSYNGDDDFGTVVDPTRAITADGGLRVCKFMECLNGLPNTEVECPTGADLAMSPAGRPGCCSTDGFDVPLDCSGTTDDSAAVFIRIDNPGNQCVSYTIDYHY